MTSISAPQKEQKRLSSVFLETQVEKHCFYISIKFRFSGHWETAECQISDLRGDSPCFLGKKKGGGGWYGILWEDMVLA